MTIMDTLQNGLNRYIGPVAAKLNGSKAIKALSSGILATTPIMLGTALIAILVNLPIDPWYNFLMGSGLYMAGMLVLTVTMNLTALYAVFAIAFQRGKGLGMNGLTSAIMTVGVYLMLMPINIVRDDSGTSFSLTTSYMGSNGFFLAIVLGLVVPSIINLLMKKLAFKLPDTVPPMVTDSLSPTFVAITLFTATTLVRWGLTFTPFDNLFDLVNQIIAIPIMNRGSSPLALIAVFTLSSLLWFFGVHPSSVSSLYSPVISMVMLQNTEAFVAGEPVPYITFMVVYSVMTLGGTGGALGIAIDALTAKSDRFKAISKISFVPALFNISEPIMFGMPVVMNPYFFVPFLINTPVVGAIAWVLSGILVPSFNPSISCPWTMPWVITGFLQGGIGHCAIVIICIAVICVLYYPFFRMADNAALAEEKASGAQEA